MEWTPKADAVVRILHPASAAERLGIPIDEVTARRRELGLGPVAVRSDRGGYSDRTIELDAAAEAKGADRQLNVTLNKLAPDDGE